MKTITNTIITGCLLASLVSAQTQDATPAQLHVQSEPESAEVSLDGIARGVTPLTLAQLSPGKHLIVIEKPGFQTVSRTVELANGDRSALSMQLEPITGLLLVTSRPEGASVAIDGAHRGETPLLVTDLMLGHHRLIVSTTGHISQERDFDLQDRTPMRIDAMLLPNSADYVVESEPAGARILLNGTARGVTPAVLENVPAGECNLELRLEGYAPYRKPLTVEAGSSDTITAILTALPAVIEVTSVPGEARIYLDNAFRGQAPLRIDDIDAGSYRLRAELEGFTPLSRSVSVTNGTTISEEFRLSSISGTLELVTTPGDVLVTIDGEIVGKTLPTKGLSLPRLPEGIHTLELRREGFHEERLRVRIERNETTQLNVDLKRLFIPDYRVVTRDGEKYEGVFVEVDQQRNLRLEVRPGIIKTFPPGSLRSRSRIRGD